MKQFYTPKKEHVGISFFNNSKLNFFILFCCCILSSHVNATVFTVTNTFNLGVGSLRQAMTDAQTAIGVPHTINFSIAAGSTITLTTVLPDVTRGLSIDATTATGWTANGVGINLNCNSLNYGIRVANLAAAANFEIYGFQIYSAFNGILINGDNADNFIIGTVNKRNFINRCTNYQIFIDGADNGQIRNNYIGCDVAGTSGYATTNNGIQLINTANNNTIGGTATGQGNLIAGGTSCGLRIGEYLGASTTGCNSNVVYGNQIGGSSSLDWDLHAIWIDGNSDFNIIGGVAAGQANDMRNAGGTSGMGYGNLTICVNGVDADGNQIRGNNQECSNGYGIVLGNPGTGAGNNGIAPPVFTSTVGAIVSGTSVADATIDIYIGSLCNSVYGLNKSKGYLTTIIANGSGNWTADLSLFGCSLNGAVATATATTVADGTSQYAATASATISIAPTCSTTPPGIYSVGPTGSFCNLQAVVSFVNNCTITGPYIFELQATYLSSSEANFPIVFNNNTGSSAANTITIRPATGIASISIISNVSRVFEFNGIDFITIDGRAGGTGSLKNLTLINTENFNSAVYINRECRNVTIRNCDISSNFGQNQLGVITIENTSGGGTGTDNLTIANCDIHGYNSTPSFGARSGIFCIGFNNASTNDNMLIQNNNFYDIMDIGTGATTQSTGVIHLGVFNSGATIEGNNIYHTKITSNSQSTNLNIYGIFVSGTGTGFNIRNNNIGGNAANCFGTWTTGGSHGFRFAGIHLNPTGATAGTFATVTGNTIKGFNWLTNSVYVVPGAGSAAVWAGISVFGGLAVGTVNRNIIIGAAGSGTVIGDNSTGSIIIRGAGLSAANGVNISGIAVYGMGSSTTTIENNSIGSITSSSSTLIVSTIEGIRVDNANNIIRFNSIGSTTPNSFDITALSTNYSAAANQNRIQFIKGIVHSGGNSTTASTIISNNTIANFRCAYSAIAGSGLVRGIHIFSANAALATNVRGAITVQNILFLILPTYKVLKALVLIQI